MDNEIICIDGPARGWGYTSLAGEAPERLVLIPHPASHRDWGRDWVRVVETEEPWPAQVVYERIDGGPEAYDRSGDLVVTYRCTSVEPEPQREFPFQDGDVTVLGPEVFASADGKTIGWKGEIFYARQGAVCIVEEGVDFVLLAREGDAERYVVSWGSLDGEPSVSTVSPCAECGWAGACEGGCHS